MKKSWTAGTVFGTFKGFFAKRPISARSGPLIGPIRRPGEAYDVATLPVGTFKGFFAKRPISARSGPLIGPIRRPGEACDVATLPGHLISPEY
jgi:hypothetical protein